jgi:biofilm PGA synthesis N-glycosyltransferase PgaC
MTGFVHTLWQPMLGFVFFYPLFMSYLWMIGALLFHWRFERNQPP